MKPHPDDERRSNWLPKPSQPSGDTGEFFGLTPDRIPSSVSGLVPTIRTPAPSAPGSETSREAAELVSIDGECLRCLIWYAQQPSPRTRYDLAVAVYPPDPKKNRKTAGVGPACGRTNDLVTLGYLVEVGRDGRSATLGVTEKGRAWLARRNVEAA